MNFFNAINFIAAAFIVIWNDELLDYAEKQAAKYGKQFDRRKAFIGTMVAVGILIIRGLLL